MFDRAKQMFELQKKARELRKQLKAHSYTAESSNGLIKITVDGEQKITSVIIEMDERLKEHPERLGHEIMDVANKALDKSKKGSAELMRSEMGGMGFPGM